MRWVVGHPPVYQKRRRGVSPGRIPLKIDADDSARVAWLHQHGRQLQGRMWWRRGRAVFISSWRARDEKAPSRKGSPMRWLRPRRRCCPSPSMMSLNQAGLTRWTAPARRGWPVLSRTESCHSSARPALPPELSPLPIASSSPDLLSLRSLVYRSCDAQNQRPLSRVSFPEIPRGRVAAMLEARLSQTMERLRQDWLAHLPNTTPDTGP